MLALCIFIMNKQKKSNWPRAPLIDHSLVAPTALRRNLSFIGLLHLLYWPHFLALPWQTTDAISTVKLLISDCVIFDCDYGWWMLLLPLDSGTDSITFSFGGRPRGKLKYPMIFPLFWCYSCCSHVLGSMLILFARIMKESMNLWNTELPLPTSTAWIDIYGRIGESTSSAGSGYFLAIICTYICTLHKHPSILLYYCIFRESSLRAFQIWS